MADPWAEFRTQPAADPWAEFRVAPQSEPSVVADVVQQIPRSINRGVNAMISLPGEIVGGAVNLVAPGQGDRFKWNNAASEFMSSPNMQPQTDAGRYVNAIGQQIGASALPVAGLMAKAGQAAVPAQTAIGQVGQRMVDSYRAAPGSAVAADVVASTGAGVGQQAARDLELGPVGEFVGGIAGGVAPFAAAAGGARVMDAVNRSPAMARYRANNAVSAEARPQSAGAAANPTLAPGEPPAPISGPEAAAYQHLANKLSAAGVRPGEIGARIERSDLDAIGGRSPLALVDTDDSLRRLAGSVVRQNDEAANIGQRFSVGRRTGITPSEGMPPGSGIPTRQAFERSSPIDPPMGMFERVRDDMRGYLQVPQRSAYRVDQDLIDVQRTQSGPQYRAAYQASAGMDIAPVVDGVLQRWTARAQDPQQLLPIAKIINAAVSIFKTPAGTVSDLQRFQTAKELLDEKIGNLMKSPVSRNRRLGGELNDFKNELLAAVDGITAGNVGTLYQNARNIYSSAADMRRALQMGRDALKEGSEASADAYRRLTLGEQQMFRIGLADAAEAHMARQKRGADVTQLFQSPRVQEIFMEVGPQDQAMRFGRNIQTQNMTVRTDNEVFGNSKTAQRQADDEAFNQMGDAIDAIRSVRSATDASFKVVKAALERIGGFRADTATELARMLFTADRSRLDDIIRNIESRMGPDRASHFKAILDQYGSNLARQSAATAATAVQPTTQQQQQTRGGVQVPRSRPPGAQMELPIPPVPNVQAPRSFSPPWWLENDPKYLPPDPKPMPPLPKDRR